MNEYLVPDVLAVAPFYKDWFSLGEGVGNFLCYGDYSSGNQNDPKMFLFPRGIVMGRDLTKVLPVDPRRSPNRSLTPGTSTRAAKPTLASRARADQPQIQRAKASLRSLDVDDKYSWLKSPRYDGKPMEVGPLARMVVGYASGKKEIVDSVDGVLKL